MAPGHGYAAHLREVFWPILDCLQAARSAVMQGFATAIFCALASACLAVLSHFSEDIAARSGFSIFGLFDAAVFLVVAVGLYFNSRLAAVGGLAYYLLQRMVNLERTPPSSFWLILIIIAFLIVGARGTFAYHRFRREAEEPVVTPVEP